MIGYLKGKILSLGTDTALIETAAGVGFEVLLSGSARGSLSGRTEGEVYTYLQVREDGVSLFGFSSLEEKEMFLKLISVSSVGPKMGIAALSQMSAGDIATAIATNDVKRLSAVKGMGKKTAERIILELHGKISADELIGETGAPAVKAALPNEQDDDAVSALMGLGFTKQESARAVERAKGAGADTIEQIISIALRGM